VDLYNATAGPGDATRWSSSHENQRTQSIIEASDVMVAID
jgi:hypothetical protein